MKITEVIPHVVFAGRTNFVLLELKTDEGINGIGEATLEGKTEAVVGAIRDLQDYVLGQDPMRVEHLWQQMYRHSFWRGGVVIGTAISAMDHAMFDIMGKALGVPVYELLGGAVRDKIRAYANGPRGANPQEIGQDTLRLKAEGWQAIKTGPPREMNPILVKEDIDALRAHIGAIRQAGGADFDILFDCHGRFNATSAVQAAEALEEFDIFFFEEPALPENPDAMAEIAAKIRIPIATGERLFFKWGFREVLEKQAATILQPDLCHCGGLWEGKKIAAMAEAYFAGVAPHNPYGPVSTLVAMHLDASTPNFVIQEYLARQEPQTDEIFPTRPKITPGGWLALPDKPGLGVEIDWQALRHYENQPYQRTFQGALWHKDGSVADW